MLLFIYLIFIIFHLMSSNKSQNHTSVMFNPPHPFNFNLHSLFLHYPSYFNDFAAPMTHFPNRDH